MNWKLFEGQWESADERGCTRKCARSSSLRDGANTRPPNDGEGKSERCSGVGPEPPRPRARGHELLEPLHLGKPLRRDAVGARAADSDPGGQRELHRTLPPETSRRHPRAVPAHPANHRPCACGPTGCPGGSAVRREVFTSSACWGRT